MEWVSGFSRGENGQLRLEAQREDGSRFQADIVALKPSFEVKRSVRRRTTLDMTSLRRVDGGEYLRGLGFEALDPGAQRFYEGTTAAGTVVIPSQLLVLSLFGASRPFRQVLLRPWGPTHLMTPSVSGSRLKALPAPNRMLRVRTDAPATEARMEWVLSYPSATAAWCSVHTNALQGHFDLQLPKASAGVSLHGRLVGSKLLVTQLRVLELTVGEAPFEFAEMCAQRHFVFNETVYIESHHGRAAAPAADANIAKDGKVVPLTDEQWALIEPLFAGAVRVNGPGANRRHSLRELVQVMRLKLGTPYSWSKCPGDKSLVQSASVLLSKLQRAGAWEMVTITLRGS